MRVSSDPYTGNRLWNKAVELVSFIGIPIRSADPDALVCEETIRSIQTNIEQALVATDPHISLFYFSKAKSSCLILEKMLPRIWDSQNAHTAMAYLHINKELIEMLDSYIHLCRVNLIVIYNKRKRTG